MSKRNDDDFASVMTRLTFGLLGQAFVGLARLAGAGVDHASGVRYGSCAICGYKVKYSVKEGESGVVLCSVCLHKVEQNTGEWKYGPNDTLPGSGLTVGALDCTAATVRDPNQYGGLHVSVYNNELGEHEHYSYDTDIDREYIVGSSHITNDMERFLRKNKLFYRS